MPMNPPTPEEMIAGGKGVFSLTCMVPGYALKRKKPKSEGFTYWEMFTPQCYISEISPTRYRQLTQRPVGPAE